MGQIAPRARQPLLEVFLFQHEGDEGLCCVRVFGEVERQDRNRELQFGRLADGAYRPERMISIFGQLLLGRIVLGCNIDRDTIGGAVQLAREECLVVGRVVPGSDARNEGVGQRLAVLQRLHGLGGIDDHLVVLIDGIGAMSPQHPVQPAVGVARGMPERVAGGRIVGLERLAHLQEPREVLGEILEARLVGRRLAVGHVTTDGGDGNAKPVVAELAGLGGSVGPSAVLLAEIVGNVIHLQHFGRE